MSGFSGIGIGGGGVGGGGIPEAPINGTLYGRRDAAWDPTATPLEIADLQTQIDTLAVGLAYVGAYDVAANLVQWIPAAGLTNGPLPPANGAGIDTGWYLICTSSGTGTGNAPPVALTKGDQLISSGPTGGAAWNVLLVGQAAVTAPQVAMNPVVSGWADVQVAIEGLNTNLSGYLPLTGGELTNPGDLRAAGSVAVGAAMPANAFANSLGAGTIFVRMVPIVGGSGETGARFGFNCYQDTGTPTQYRYLANGPAAHLVQTDQAATNGTFRLFMAPRGVAGQVIPPPGQPGGWYLVDERALGTTSAGILLNGAVGIGDRPPQTAPHGSLTMFGPLTLAADPVTPLEAATRQFVESIAVQTPWRSNINAANFNLDNAGHVGIGTASSTRALTIEDAAQVTFDIYAVNTNSAATQGMAMLNDANDQIQFGLGGSNVGAVNLRRLAFLLSTRDLAFGTGPAFTERMRISQSGNVGIGNSAAVLPYPVPSLTVIFGSTADASSANAIVATNTPPVAVTGGYGWANYAIAGAEKRIAQISARVGTAIDSGEITFSTWDAGVEGERMRIAEAGLIRIFNLPTADPGVPGALWYDPLDGTVKYSP